MERTEQYTVIFAKLSPERYSVKQLEDYWRYAELEEYSKSGVAVDAAISQFNYVCGSIPPDSNYCLQAVVVRNPVVYSDTKVYFHSFSNIILKVKEMLGNPYSAIISEQKYFTFFEKL